MIEYNSAGDNYRVVLPSTVEVLPGYIVRDLLGIPMSELVKLLDEKAVHEYLRFHVSYGLRGSYVAGYMALVRARLEGTW